MFAGDVESLDIYVVYVRESLFCSVLDVEHSACDHKIANVDVYHPVQITPNPGLMDVGQEEDQQAAKPVAKKKPSRPMKLLY